MSTHADTTARPRIAILGRFAEHTSVTRHAGVVSARRLLEMVWAAGGEPVTMLPVADEVDGANWAARLSGLDGVLMPGGGDIAPSFYGQQPNTDELYGVDAMQDAADISLVKWALANGMPVLAICRGMQITNVALGGTLVQHMDAPHQHRLETLSTIEDADGLGCGSDPLTISCFHHQAVDQVAEGVTVLATSEHGIVEAVRFPSTGWAYGVQWHPEDNFDTQPGQLAIARRFVQACRA